MQGIGSERGMHIYLTPMDQHFNRDVRLELLGGCISTLKDYMHIEPCSALSVRYISVLI